jgi:hypothetical protein
MCLRSLPGNDSTVLGVLQRDWDAHIAQLEFANNNTVNGSTGQTPFYVASSQHRPTLDDALRQAQSLQDANFNTVSNPLCQRLHKLWT